MQVLLAHWHCIIPAAAVLVGLALMGKKPGQKERDAGESGEKAVDHEWDEVV
jgi:hypothetical protein